MYTEYLYHSGIQGMKWGIRRYQNPDGTWTEAGKARYGHSSSFVSDKDPYMPKGVKIDGETKESDRRDAERRRKSGVKEEQSYDSRKARKEAKKQIRKDAKNRHTMSDEELDEKIKRLKKEKELKDLTDKDVNEGKAYTKEILKDTGKRVIPAVATVTALYLGKEFVKSGKAAELTSDIYKYVVKKK